MKLKWPTAEEWENPPWRDPALVTDPDWIVYNGAPTELSDRARYENVLATCELIWKETNDSSILSVATTWVSIHHQLTRPWLLEAFRAVVEEDSSPGAREAFEKRIIDRLPVNMRAYAKAMFKRRAP
jgi:hypothetical protein